MLTDPLQLSQKRTSHPDSAHRRSVLVLKREKLAPANGMLRRVAPLCHDRLPPMWRRHEMLNFIYLRTSQLEI